MDLLGLGDGPDAESAGESFTAWLQGDATTDATSEPVRQSQAASLDLGGADVTITAPDPAAQFIEWARS